MLVNRDSLAEVPAGLSSVHNFYERVVLEKVREFNRARGLDADTLADIACVALNRLPPRYIRHDVDMAFYLSPFEYDEIEQKVQQALSAAIHFVESRGQRRSHEEDLISVDPAAP